MWLINLSGECRHKPISHTESFSCLLQGKMCTWCNQSWIVIVQYYIFLMRRYQLCFRQKFFEWDLWDFREGGYLIFVWSSMDHHESQWGSETKSRQMFHTSWHFYDVTSSQIGSMIIVLSEVRNNICCEVAKSHCLLFEKPFVIGRKWRRLMFHKAWLSFASSQGVGYKRLSELDTQPRL